MNEVAAPRSVSFGHVEAALRLVRGIRNQAADAPGLRVQRNGAALVLTGRPADAVGRGNAVNRENPGNPVNLFEYSLSIPGEIRLPETGYIVSAELNSSTAVGDRQAATGKGQVALVRRDLCRDRVKVRNRRPGDRFRPVGLRRGKKLQDYFVDRKVARARRDLVPLIVDEENRIVWVAGYGIDEAFRVTDASQGVLILKVRQV
jgi:tRNA(Ile)-lysidine synthetase-like protein